MNISYLHSFMGRGILLSMAIFFLIQCGKSQTMQVIPEPVVDQVSILSDEICLDSYLWIISAKPCVAIQGIKDNSTGKREFRLIYRLSTFDVEFPLGVSLKLDGEFYNLPKVTTEYGDTLELSSSLPENLVSTVLKAKKIGISYTNRKETTNHELDESDRKELVDALQKISDSLKKEPKLKINR